MVPNNSKSDWRLCSQKLPKNEIIYLTQVVLIYIVVCSCIINISLGYGNQALWSSLLSGCLGYILPSPSLKHNKDSLTFDLTDNKDVPLLPSSTE